MLHYLLILLNILYIRARAGDGTVHHSERHVTYRGREKKKKRKGKQKIDMQVFPGENQLTEIYPIICRIKSLCFIWENGRDILF